jgi:anti-sigma factor RsiW
MADCRRIADRITAYVDESLSPADRADVERHLKACPPCREAAAEEHAGRVVLRQCARRLRREPIPPALRTRCEALAREQCAARAARWRAALLPVSLATMLVVATGTAIAAIATQRSDTLLAAQLTADHLKCFRAFPPEDVETDAARVEQMLRERYGWDVRLPGSSTAEGLRLIGARRCLYLDGRVPHVMYRVNGEDVSLFILAGVNRRDADVVTLGQRARIWSRGANTYVLVSSASGRDLAGAAGYLRQEAR